MSQQEGDEQQRAEAANPATSAQRLEALSTNPFLRRIVAGNPAASALLLERLAQDQDEAVCQAVASNPNTPWKTLEALAEAFPQAFLHNPVGLWYLLGQPEHISTDAMFCGALLREESIPSLWWIWLRDHAGPDVHRLMHMHVQSAGETSQVYGLLEEEEEEVIFSLVELSSMACAQGMMLPPVKRETPIGPWVVTGKEIVEERLHWLVHHSDDRMRIAGASHELTPAKALLALASDEKASVREAVARNEQTLPEWLRLLAEDQQHKVRLGVAENQRTPPEILHLLAKDQEVWVREAVARNKQTPPEALHLLAKDENKENEWEERKSSEVREAVAWNEQTPSEVLHMLAKDEDSYVRFAVARNERTWPETLKILAQDADKDVRGAVAENEQTPLETLKAMAKDKDPHVRTTVAWSEHISPEVVSELVKDENNMVRAGAVWNKLIPQGMLRALAQDPQESVREAVAWNKLTPPDVLGILGRDVQDTVREAVARNPQTPGEVLAMLAQDSACRIRDVVAWNPCLSSEIRAMLAQQDPDPHVRWSGTLISGLIASGESMERIGQWWDECLWAYVEARQVYVAEQLKRIFQLTPSNAMRRTILALLALRWDTPALQETSRVFTIDAGALDHPWRALARLLLVPCLPSLALQKLATSSSWEVRYLVALHEQTPWETRQQLSQDGNRYVRAMARACLHGTLPGGRK
ncbi:MAG TPA: hypothetical protein VFN35_33900 [Ktedonobacteraceae bacterium]|nr:hypothetical protein [Ktedonobacteraceae bacterium]